MSKPPTVPSLPLPASPKRPAKRKTTTTTLLNLSGEYAFLSPRELPPAHDWDDSDPLKLEGTLQPPVPRCELSQFRVRREHLASPQRWELRISPPAPSQRRAST